MYLKTLEIRVLKCINLTLFISYHYQNVKLELLTDYDMLLMAEKGIRGGICHAIHRHAKANNKCMKKL